MLLINTRQFKIYGVSFSIMAETRDPFFTGKSWFSPKGISEGLFVNEQGTTGIHDTEIVRLRDFDPVHGVAWWQETSIIEAPDGTHIFRDQERVRLLTYWDITHYLQLAGFKEIKCYPDWKINSPKKPKAETLIFVAKKRLTVNLLLLAWNVRDESAQRLLLFRLRLAIAMLVLQ
jgi:hypothetical protein